jgi:hypothetical protein
VRPRHVPESGLFFGGAEVVRTQDGVEVSGEPDARELDREAFGVGVGGEHHTLAERGERGEELGYPRVRRDQMRDLAFDLCDLDAQLSRPVIDAIPGQ